MERELFRSQTETLARTLLDAAGLHDVEAVVDDWDPENPDCDGVTLRLRKPTGKWRKFAVPERSQFESEVKLDQIVRAFVKNFTEEQK